MKQLNADPKFAAANRERMKQLNADPKFAAANRERMKQLHADPAFERRRIAALRKSFKVRRERSL